MKLPTTKLITIATALLLLSTIKRNRPIVYRKKWMKDWLLEYGTESLDGLWYEKVFDEWAKTDPERYRRTLRLPPAIFKQLLEMVEPYIRKQDTVMRKSISPEKRLAITLKYLATGESFYSLSGQFCVGASTVAMIVKETCNAIIHVLKDVLTVPNTADEWKEVSNDYYRIWDYPNCVGALDGKHILIKPPPNSGSDYFNYKNQFSIVLMGLVDAHYRFIYVNVGAEGRVGDAGLWNRSDLKSKIASGQINFPSSENLPNTPSNFTKIPFHIIGDSAFQLQHFLMKPFSQVAINNDTQKRVFNYRLSRARRCVENAFGILSHRFEVFRAPIRTDVDTADKIVLATVALHNWFMTDRMMRHSYCPTQLCDQIDEDGNVTLGTFDKGSPPGGMVNLSNQGCNRSPSSAISIREYIYKYFVSQFGSRPWQNKYLI
ncbi:hypothetical protein HA402_013297 [Bradysia odoriphaga]|nr:hypothetical protein HA402_013297 [Bradysia odoriphaga]